jgi:hypothetical protein
MALAASHYSYGNLLMREINVFYLAASCTAHLDICGCLQSWRPTFLHTYTCTSNVILILTFLHTYRNCRWSRSPIPRAAPDQLSFSGALRLDFPRTNTIRSLEQRRGDQHARSISPPPRCWHEQLSQPRNVSTVGFNAWV